MSYQDYDDNDRLTHIMQAVGRIEGKLESLTPLPARVEKLERWRSWLSGAWAVVTAAFLYLWKTNSK